TAIAKVTELNNHLTKAGGDGAGIAPLTSLTAPCAEVWRIQLLWSIRRADDAYYSALLEE
ncbi:hypothetical protein AB0G40_42475, partial [Streptomyces griseorubiginosus]